VITGLTKSPRFETAVYALANGQGLLLDAPG